MSFCQFLNPWDVLIPGTHDSFAYKTKNFYPLGLERIILTQSKTIKEQLELGIRYLDLRVCSYRATIGSPLQYYTSHSGLCVPLEDILSQIKTFLNGHKSEFLFLSLKADYFPLNMDLFTQNGDIVQKIDINDQYYTDDLIKYVNAYLGATKIVNVVSIYAIFRDLTSLGQQVFLLVEDRATSSVNYPLGVSEIDSWYYTWDSDPYQNHQKCIQYLSIKSYSEPGIFAVLNHHTTFDISYSSNSYIGALNNVPISTPTTQQEIIDLLRSLVYYQNTGLQGYAKASNRFLKEYINSQKNLDVLGKANAIIVDFADQNIVDSIIDLNFLYL